MGFFDSPEHRPPTSRLEVGDTLTGRITGLDIRENLRGRNTLVYQLDGGMWRWANSRLWRAFIDARADVGMTCTITRLPDDPATGDGMAGTNWRIDLQQAPAAAAAPAPAVIQTRPALPDW